MLNLFDNEKKYFTYPPTHDRLHITINIGDDVVEFVETQIGEHFDKEDIVRYKDDFGRVYFNIYCNII